MQFTPFLAALLLAPLTVTADESTRFVKADDIVIPRALLNRAPASELSPVREYAAPRKTNANKARDILMGRASTCADSTQFACTNSDGCCDIGTICGVYGGVEGCCRIGKNCTSTKGCESTEVDCGGGCCPSGSTCATDSTGAPKCRTSGSGSSSNSQCSMGYSPCAGQDVCCPTGVKCLADNKCQIPCTSRDPVCGDGCCKVGSVCNVSRGTCSSSGSSGSTIIKSSSPSSTAASGSSAKSKPTNTSSELEATPTATDDSASDSNSGYNSTNTSSPSKATAKGGATTTGGSGAKSTPSTSSNSGVSTSSGAERGVVVGMFGAAIVGVVAGLVMV